MARTVDLHHHVIPDFYREASNESGVELDYALTTLELDGVSLMSNAGGRHLGDARFGELFAQLRGRAAVVFVHPTGSPDPIAQTLGLPDTLLDYPLDTSRAIAKLDYSDTFARTPDVRCLFAHAGGTIPYVSSRFANVDAMDVVPGADERGSVHDTLGRSTGIWPRRSAIPCWT